MKPKVYEAQKARNDLQRQANEELRGVLSYDQLLKAISAGFLDNARPEHVNAASIDVTLADTLCLEAVPSDPASIRLSAKETISFASFKLEGKPFTLGPQEGILASTCEVFNLPNFLAAEFRLKSSVARNFLDHRFAVWVDPGFHGSSLTLELYNGCKYHALELTPGMKIGQVIMYMVEPVPDHASYATRGQYNRQGTGPTASKGSR